ncbi:MAG: SDR family oxidoreductase [Anaerolineae bacterium]|nr:SDR family oxidoreductase [Anaerolineae bacterium]
MDLELKDKVALVTAASRGLGYATAQALAREGARVAICARKEDALREATQRLLVETHADVLPVIADVTKQADVERLVKTTREHFGSIDMLFINAGGPRPGNFSNLRPADWESATQLTIQSVVWLAYAVVPIMREKGGGSILANTSVTVRMPLDGLTLSNSLRLAVVGMVKSLSVELGADNIRINAIAPGWTRTERVDEILRARAEHNVSTLEEEAAKITTDVPLRRMASSEEFGRIAAFLLSPIASYITGITLVVDGGMSKALM